MIRLLSGQLAGTRVIQRWRAGTAGIGVTGGEDQERDGKNAEFSDSKTFGHDFLQLIRRQRSLCERFALADSARRLDDVCCLWR